MHYNKTLSARFVSRPNRFIAQVDIEGKTETVHVKNTGRCKELLLPDSKVILYDANNEKRKTRYDLIAVEKSGLGLVNIDSQAPNKVMAEFLAGRGYDVVQPEFRYGNSRIDFYMKRGDQQYLLEVKGCTLEREGIGYFPDAPTERGIKHIHELIQARQEGYWCGLAFVIQMPLVSEVRPNIVTHPAFGDAWNEALAAGVKIWFIGCKVNNDSLIVDEKRIVAEE
ncbi:DNA/RNA nuclease SfsA [Anaerovibrio sp. RM50]|uniref:DNA/RNA nuclease SfsA n=1 Tax=Anaerovibrio sp. RM50 TaxID=1200557 RepID=UPI00048728AA|nr:DNA/RNA nuclease SfsA [Anaerovibrio sp. RM50]